MGSANMDSKAKLPIAPKAPLIEVRNLTKHFFIYRGSLLKRRIGAVRAVDGVSFAIGEGETLGLVGESGCGKSTTGRLMTRLIEPSSGDILFRGRSIQGMGREATRRLRREMQIIFQDPYASLNPRMNVEQIIGDPLLIHGMRSRRERRERVFDLLSRVGLPLHHASRYPHEFSGGQRQRVGIARALALNPQLVVCDEPVSALDVSVQAQIVNLLRRLQEELNLSYLFISHDLSVVKHVCDRIAVMYLGRVVEIGPKRAIYTRPAHPYTQSLLSTIPVPDPERRRQRIVLEGEMPDPSNPPPGCRFHKQCPMAMDVCRQVEPELTNLEGGHYSACHLTGEGGVATGTDLRVKSGEGHGVD